MSLRIKQDEVYRANDWWEWSVWLEGPSEELAEVACVVYTLHPSFTPPMHTVRTRRNGFRLSGQGWGTFAMHLEIRLRDKTVKQRRYNLKLHYPESAAPAPEKGVFATPSVFLSSTATDADTAQAIREALVGHGVEVLGDVELGSGTPLSRALTSDLARAGHALFVMSGRPSLWMSREIDAAHEHHVPVTAVLVGKGTRVPEFLDGTRQLRVEGADDIAAAMAAFAESLDGSALALRVPTA